MPYDRRRIEEARLEAEWKRREERGDAVWDEEQGCYRLTPERLAYSLTNPARAALDPEVARMGGIPTGEAERLQRFAEGYRHEERAAMTRAEQMRRIAVDEQLRRVQPTPLERVVALLSHLTNDRVVLDRIVSRGLESDRIEQKLLVDLVYAANDLVRAGGNDGNLERDRTAAVLRELQVVRSQLVVAQEQLAVLRTEEALRVLATAPLEADDPCPRCARTFADVNADGGCRDGGCPGFDE